MQGKNKQGTQNKKENKSARQKINMELENKMQDKQLNMVLENK